MSLMKIPLVGLVAWYHSQGITPPNPPPAKEELTQQTGYNFDTSWYIRHVPPLAVKLNWIACALEILTIINYHFLSILPRALDYRQLLFKAGRVPSLDLTFATTLGALLVLVGGTIRLLTYRSLGTFFRFEASIQKDHQLITTGPYAVVRHPAYTGLLFLQLGWCLWHFGSGSLVRESILWHSHIGKLGMLCYCAYVPFLSLHLTLSRMKFEDAALRAKFRDSWDKWSKEVPYSLIPGVY